MDNEQMSEQEIMETLAREFLEDERAQETDEEQQAQQSVETKTQPDTQAQINAKTLEALNQIIANQGTLKQQEQVAQEPTEQELALQELGLGDLAKQINQMSTQLASQQEMIARQTQQAEQMEIFQNNISQLKKDFPTIDPDDMAKWAKENDMLDLISNNYKHWKIVANAMLKTATPTQDPDAITSSSGSGGSVGAFERLKKGEAVDELELGVELLKIAGAKI